MSSRVLATAIQRSRNKWIYGGPLERYWTKPSKKKQQAGEINNNPGRDTMRTIGQCSLFIEPHIFEVILYGVKQTGPSMAQGQPLGPRPSYPTKPDDGFRKQPWLAQPPGYQAPLATPKWQIRGTPDSKDYSSPATPGQPNQQYQVAGRPPSTQGNHNGGNDAYKPVPPAVTAPTTPGQRTSDQTTKHQMHPPVMPPAPAPLQTPTPAPAPMSAPAPGPGPSSDPVIHMLAQRAGHDPQLKSVMKIVAAGEANPDQLQFFQRHIDELTSLLQTRTNAGLPPIPGPMPPRQSHHMNPHPTQPPRPPYGAGVYGSNSQPIRYPATPTYPLQPKGQHATTGTSKTFQSGSFNGRGWASPARVENFSSILVEFVGGTGDRFRLPKNSIVEYLPGGKQAILSFLLIQKYTQSNQGNMEIGKEYYEPVTFRFVSDNSRVLASMAWVVDHPDAVRRYMNDIMDKVPRAEHVFLAFRLPKDGSAEESPDDYSREDSIARSMTPVGGPVVRKPRGPYKKRVKVVEAPVEKKVGGAPAEQKVEEAPTKAKADGASLEEKADEAPG